MCFFFRKTVSKHRKARNSNTPCIVRPGISIEEELHLEPKFVGGGYSDLDWSRCAAGSSRPISMLRGVFFPKIGTHV